MITGIGIDLVEINRLRRSLQRYGDEFLNHVYTGRERAQCERHPDPAPRLALYLAAKEAAFKAIGYPPKIRWHDLEVVEKSGRPEISLSGTARETAQTNQALASFTPSGDKEKDLITLTTKYKEIIEDYIKRYPDQWYMFRRYWTQPFLKI